MTATWLLTRLCPGVTPPPPPALSSISFYRCCKRFQGIRMFIQTTILSCSVPTTIFVLSLFLLLRVNYFPQSNWAVSSQKLDQKVVSESRPIVLSIPISIVRVSVLKLSRMLHVLLLYLLSAVQKKRVLYLNVCPVLLYNIYFEMYFNCTSKNWLRIKNGHSEENVNIHYLALFLTETLIQVFTDQCLLYFRKRQLPFKCSEISPLTMVLLLKLA